MASWHIKVSGNDITGDGSYGNPYATLEKALLECNNGDTIKFLSDVSAYTFSTTVNVNKEVTITTYDTDPNSVVIYTDVIALNIQASNVSITYLAIASNVEDPIINVDFMTDYTIIPTFWNNFTVAYCAFQFNRFLFRLTGTFNITNNTFIRETPPPAIGLPIAIYSMRGLCSISNNTYRDRSYIETFIELTFKKGNGEYYDRSLSKGGTLTFANNNILYPYDSTNPTIIRQTYFNQYSYGSVGQDEQYNMNTKLKYDIHNNYAFTATWSRLLYIKVVAGNDFNMFGSCTIHDNELMNTDYGALHLDKSTTVHNAVTINSNDLNRAIFKIYSNILNTVPFTMLTTYSYNYTMVLSVKRVEANHRDPIFRIRRSSDDMTESFYDFAHSGYLTTYDMVPIATWLAGANAFIETWYNQAIFANSNATQGDPNLQPQLVLGNPNHIDFKANTNGQYLSIGDGEVPYGNANYSLQLHYKSTGGNSGIIVHSGDIGGTGKIANSLYVGTSGHASYWNTDAESGTVYSFGTVADNTCIVTSYDGSNRHGWINGTAQTSEAATSRASTSSTNRIGYAGTGHEVDISIYSVYIMNAAATGTQVTNMNNVANTLFMV